MFSGKSEELIRRLKRARIARQRVACYKPDIDLRYHRTAIASHNEQTYEATIGSNLQDPATVDVVVENGDDPPLPITAVRLEMRQRSLCSNQPVFAVASFFIVIPHLTLSEPKGEGRGIRCFLLRPNNATLKNPSPAEDSYRSISRNSN
jgi:hypothetical protein